MDTLSYRFALACALLVVPVGSGAAPVSGKAKTRPVAKKTIPPRKMVPARVPLVGEYVSFPAAGVKLRQPAGMVRSETWTGFEADSARSSVMLVKIAGPYAEVSKGFAAEHMAPRGMKLVSKTERAVDGLPGVLVYFTMTAGGAEWDKWALVFGEASRTHILTATFPSVQRKRWTEPVKAALLSTRLKVGGAAEEPSFGLTVSPKLKPAAAISGMLTYTRDGMVPAKSPEDPFVVVGPSLSKTPVLDTRQFSEQRLRATEQTRITGVLSHEPVTIDELEGYESVADATDAKSGTPIVLYQVLLFDADRYFILQGLVGAKLREEYLPEFKAMARSFKRMPRTTGK